MTGTHAPHDCGTCCEARGCEPDVFAVTHGPLTQMPSWALDALDKAIAAAVARAEARLLEYENAITWHTACL